MVEITDVKVYDLEESIVSCRNAMRTAPAIKYGDKYSNKEFRESLERAVKLAKSPSNSGHCSWLKGVRVNFDLKYPQYISKQFQRYHFFDYIASSSMMHRLTYMEADKICNKYVSRNVVEQLQSDIDLFNKICSEEWKEGTKWHIPMRDSEHIIAETKADALYYAYMKCISDCPMGAELFVRVSTNYMQLRTIYHQRKNHKLKEDWGAFCKFIEGLPYFEEFINQK